MSSSSLTSDAPRVSSGVLWLLGLLSAGVILYFYAFHRVFHPTYGATAFSWLPRPTMRDTMGPNLRASADATLFVLPPPDPNRDRVGRLVSSSKRRERLDG